MAKLAELLRQHQSEFGSVLPEAWQQAKVVPLDFTGARFDSPAAMQDYVNRQRHKHPAGLAVGRYAERREFYTTAQFQGDEARCIHLGLDLNLPAGTPIHAPLAGSVHSFQDNNAAGDYGPTLILQHQLAEFRFYTLYGHLSRSSIQHWQLGKPLVRGAEIGQIGSIAENGGWPPHLHFQVIKDLQGNTGDYPGVCRASEAAFYLANCPDPNLILQLY